MTNVTRTKCMLDPAGHELLDDTPIAVPLGFQIPESLNEQVARLVRHHRFQEGLGLDADSHDTYDEADDFDIGDDFDPSSPFEQVFDQLLQRHVTPADFMANQEHYAKLYAAAAKEEFPDEPAPAEAPAEPPATE